MRRWAHVGERRLVLPTQKKPPGQDTAETLHTLQTLLLRLIKREDLVFRRQRLGLELQRETLIGARAGREVSFEYLVEIPWMEKGKTKETMSNFFDMKTRYVKEHVDSVVEKIKRELDAEERK